MNHHDILAPGSLKRAGRNRMERYHEQARALREAQIEAALFAIQRQAISEWKAGR